MINIVKNLIYALITYKEAKPFVINIHYSKLCPPAKIYFGVFLDSILMGVATFNQPTSRGQAKHYYPSNPKKLLELQRLCLVDELPKNSESRFIAWCLRWLKKNTKYLAVIAFADPNFGHLGIVYQASNFRLITDKAAKRYYFTLDDIRIAERTLSHQNGTSSLTKLQAIYGNRIQKKPCEYKRVYIYTF